MSRENVEIVRTAIEAWGAGDMDSSLDPDMIWNPVEAVASQGHEGLRATLSSFYEVYTVRDGKVMRMDEYATRAKALEAAGLRE